MATLKQFKVGLSLCLFSAATQATVIEITNLDSGWYNSVGTHNATNTNYIAGNCCGSTYRNFFVFDLTGLGNVASATLQLFSGTVTASGQYQLWDVSTAVNDLRAGGSGKVATFSDLGSGVSFASHAVDSNQDNQLIQITLNADAIQSLNAASGLWAIGGTFGAAGSEKYVFGSTAYNSSNKLLLTMAVFEPASVALMGLGLSGLVLSRRLASR